MENLSRPAQSLSFGAFEVNLRTGELRKQGRKIRLQEQPFQILASLLERPGELVTREELRQRLWPGDTFVDFEHSLNTAVKKLRQALGDDTDKPHFIETLPRRGYRFIAPVDTLGRSEAEPALAPPEHGHPQRAPVLETEEPQAKKTGLRYSVVIAGLGMTAVLGTAIALNVGGLRERVLRRGAVGHIHSLAVLPLENLSGDPAQEYFADGMTDELTTDLAQISALRVISRTSAMRYKGTKKPLPQIGRELNVDAVVEGAVMRSGNRVKITAQLIQTTTDRHLWARSYERDLREIIGLEREAAQAIATEIRAQLTPQEKEHLASARPVDPEAYQAYLQGRYFFNQQFTPETFKKSAEYFQKAIEKDSKFALPYVGLADSYSFLGLLGALPPKEAMPKAKAMAERALAIDDTLGEAHSPLAAVLFYYDWDWSGAEREFKRAIQLNPGYGMAHLWYSWYLVYMGRFDEAIAQANRARELDPLSLLANWNLGNTLFFARQYDRALELCHRVLEMDPNYERAHFTLARIYEQKGLYKEARAEYQKRSDLSPHRLWDLIVIAGTYAGSGEKRKAKELLAQALKEKPIEGDQHAFLFARAYLKLGEKDQAFKWLEKAYENRDWPLVQLNVAPQWDPIRSDPRFQNLVRRVGLPAIQDSHSQKTEKR